MDTRTVSVAWSVSACVLLICCIGGAAVTASASTASNVSGIRPSLRSRALAGTARPTTITMTRAHARNRWSIVFFLILISPFSYSPYLYRVPMFYGNMASASILITFSRRVKTNFQILHFSTYTSLHRRCNLTFYVPATAKHHCFPPCYLIGFDKPAVLCHNGTNSSLCPRQMERRR